MNAEQAPVVGMAELVNNFLQISLQMQDAPLAKPGHYVILAETTPCYLMSHDAKTVTLMVNKDLLPLLSIGTHVSVSSFQGVELPAPIDNTFHLVQANEEGLNTVIFYLKKYRRQFHGLILLGAKQFPFKPCPSRLLIPGIPNDVIAAIPLFEDWHIPHRLTSTQEQPGCFHGTTDELATIWLNYTKIAKPLKKLYIAPLS
jgi:hypothetical protein